MRRALSASEIAELHADFGLGRYAPQVESVIVIDADDEARRSLRDELRIRGVTGTLCAEYFVVDLFETDTDSCLIEWLVRTPNGHEWSFGDSHHSGGFLDLRTVRIALRHATEIANAWGRMFRDMAAARGMADEAAEIANAAGNLRLQLETVRTSASHLAAEARAAPDRAVHSQGALANGIATLEELIARLKAVNPPD